MPGTDLTVVTSPKLLQKLSQLLDLLLNATQKGSKSHHNLYHFDLASFNKKPTLANISVNLINDCLLNHRFEEAGKLLWVMCQNRSCFNLILFKGVMVVLENLLSNHEIEIIETFSNDIRKLNYVNKLEIQLEYLISSLKNDIQESQDTVKEAKTFRKRTIKIIPHIEQLYSAYLGLKNYITWAVISRGEASVEEEEQIAFSVITCFKEVISHPGIWDIFVLKLIEVLEHYGRYEELEEVLKKYVELNPNHVNAYIYVCIHLHRHNPDPNLFIHYAKILLEMCPSDERVLLLVQKWHQLGKYLKKRIKILFMFLDYPANGGHVLGWKLLSSHLMQAVSSNKSSTMKAVWCYWKPRCCVWNYLHFLEKDIFSEDFELISSKVEVLLILNPDHQYIKNVKMNFQHRIDQKLSSENYVISN